jgi:hypothetical protein
MPLPTLLAVSGARATARKADGVIPLQGRRTRLSRMATAAAPAPQAQADEWG